VSLRTPAHNFSVAQERVGVTSKRRQCSCRTCQTVYCRATLLDVTQFDSVAPLAGVVEAELGPVDVVINNAVASDAISSSRPMERIATRGWATAFG
jgi:NAD(P)-dependent dehydrogenase (short-subunit alcohol dehydrogenase family)